MSDRRSKYTAAVVLSALIFSLTSCASRSETEPCAEGRVAVAAITRALDDGLESRSSEEVSANLADLRQIASGITDSDETPAGKALTSVREATEEVAAAGEEIASGRQADVAARIDSLVESVGKLDQACGGSILSPEL